MQKKLKKKKIKKLQITPPPLPRPAFFMDNIKLDRISTKIRRLPK